MYTLYTYTTAYGVDDAGQAWNIHQISFRVCVCARSMLELRVNPKNKQNNEGSAGAQSIVRNITFEFCTCKRAVYIHMLLYRRADI